MTKTNRHFCASSKKSKYGAQKLDSLHFMVIPLQSLPSSFPPSREVNCKQTYKSEHCFSALKQSGTVILCLYKHNFALLELTADKVYASAWAGCVSEGDPKDHQAQWQSLQPANFIKEDGSGRAAGLSWAVVAEASSIFFPLVPCNKSSLGFL